MEKIGRFTRSKAEDVDGDVRVGVAFDAPGEDGGVLEWALLGLVVGGRTMRHLEGNAHLPERRLHLF